MQRGDPQAGGGPQDRGTIAPNINAEGAVTSYTVDPDDAGPAAAFTVDAEFRALGGTAAPLHSQGRDIDRDGDRDVWLLFSLCDLVTNGAIDQNSTELVLTGRTLEGGAFTARDGDTRSNSMVVFTTSPRLPSGSGTSGRSGLTRPRR